MGYKIKYRILRFIVRWRRWRMNPDTKLLTPYEEKAIRLWKILLKDEDTQMAYNSHGVRQIEKNNIFMIFQPTSGTDFIITLMSITDDNNKSLYEIYIPLRHASIVCDCFDDEMDRRMRKVSESKRSIIEEDIDRLIKIEEKLALSRINEN